MPSQPSHQGQGPRRVSRVATVPHHHHPLLSSLPSLFRSSKHITDKDSPPKRRLPLLIPQPPKHIIEHARGVRRAREADRAEGAALRAFGGERGGGDLRERG
jgi:hypothetical protein